MDNQDTKLERIMNKPSGVRRIREMIREEIEAKLSTPPMQDYLQHALEIGSGVAGLPAEHEPENPPAIPRHPGGKYKGSRTLLPGCPIDKVLFDLFKQEQHQTRGTAAAVMQRILWLHYGKPKLSFEE